MKDENGEEDYSLGDLVWRHSSYSRCSGMPACNIIFIFHILETIFNSSISASKFTTSLPSDTPSLIGWSVV